MKKALFEKRAAEMRESKPVLASLDEDAIKTDADLEARLLEIHNAQRSPEETLYSQMMAIMALYRNTRDQ